MLKIERIGTVDLVTFEITRINALVAEDIKEQVNRVFDQQGAKVVFDLKGVEYIDSSGFGCFLSALRRARDNYGSVRLTGLEQPVRDLFKTLHLDTVFDIRQDADEAINSFR
ncbi:MAG: STAS domain-containing protein [Bacteroidales bacterium]